MKIPPSKFGTLREFETLDRLSFINRVEIFAPENI